MAAHQLIRAEVYIQDYFFEPAEQDAGLDEVAAAIASIDAPALASSDSSAPITPEIWESWFQQWLSQLQPDLSPTHAYELSLRLTTDQDIQTVNDQYRHQNQPTDVLAFAALDVDVPYAQEMAESMPFYLGDIIISVETATVQAQQQGHSLIQELAWLATHGLLHLLGWDHPDDDSLQQMLNQQALLLQGIDLQEIVSR